MEYLHVTGSQRGVFAGATSLAALFMTTSAYPQPLLQAADGIFTGYRAEDWSKYMSTNSILDDPVSLQHGLLGGFFGDAACSFNFP